jgi:predicted membrane protein (TIGR00267 family)
MITVDVPEATLRSARVVVAGVSHPSGMRPADIDDGRPAPIGARNLREVVMGAQDNLTTVLAVVLGVAIGSGELEAIALAGCAAGIAEAISMGGVLYTATRAERELAASDVESSAVSGRLKEPVVAALVTFVAALIAAAIPLAPFLFLSVRAATITAAVLSVAALFGLGAWTGRITGRNPWRGGIRFVAIGGLAALAAALVGAALKVDAA